MHGSILSEPGRCALWLVLSLCALPASGAVRFREVSQAWRIDFRHHHGGTGERYMVETMVGGVVVFDFDGDGDQDLFFVDGGRLPGYAGEAPRSRLLRNDGPGRFTDWTDEAGLVIPGYTCGATAGDVDGDGDLDLFVSGFGPDYLFRNQGDGTFRDDTAAAGVSDPLWSTSAAFADTDGDGDLDLYVASYVDFALDNHKFCGDQSRNLRGYCTPEVYHGRPHRFYRNKGDGTFEDAAAKAGLAGAVGPGLGVVFSDFDDDGWPDLYVANDLQGNFLFHNRGDGTFEDQSLLSGTAFGDAGRPEAGMGVDAGDYDGDGLTDLVVTNFELETNALYRNLGEGAFVDARHLARIAEPSLLMLAWGVAFADLDQDGDLDLTVANGHLHDIAPRLREGSRWAQRNQVFENLGNGRFAEDLASGMDVERVSRGLATGDLDGDGDLEVVVVNSNDLAEVYENQSRGGGYVSVELRGFGIGARIEVEAGGKKQLREVRTGSSYLSQNALAAHFGVGDAASVTVRVKAKGAVRELRGVPANRRVMVPGSAGVPPAR